MRNSSYKTLFVGCVLLALCHETLAQNGYSYERPGANAQNRPGYSPTSPGGFPTAAGFPSTVSATTPAYQAGGITGYPLGRPTGTGFSSGSGGGNSFNPGPTVPSTIGNFPTQADGEFTTGPQYPGGQGATPSFPNAGPGFAQNPAGVSPFPSAGAGPGVTGGFPGTGSAGFTPSGPAAGSNSQFPLNQRPTQAGGAQRPAASFDAPQSGSGGQGGNDGQYEGGDYSAIPGNPGSDYPIYSEIPETSFDCINQEFPGYYADVEAQCQVFHICALNRTFNFLCPNGTIFSQQHLVCVWWNQFDCSTAPSLFANNANIYDYSQTGRPPTAQQDQQGQYPGGAQQGGSPSGPGAPQSTFGGSTRPQQAQRPTPSTFPVSLPGAIGPAGNYPSGAASPSPNYPIPSGAGGYPPSNQGPIGQPATSYPLPQGTGGPYQPSAPSSPSYPISLVPNVGYPGGPTGAGFPPSGQSDAPAFAPTSPQTPTREYLPPRRG